MKIGVISDIHDNIWKLSAALQVLRRVDTVLCCGDLCSPFIVPRLGDGFAGDIHIVFGNNDGDLFRISQLAAKYPNIHLHGEFVSLQIGGQQFALTHFDNIAREVAAGQAFDVVCFGHNHLFEIRREGRTLLINPGEIMGGLPPTRSRVLSSSTPKPARRRRWSFDLDSKFQIPDSKLFAGKGSRGKGHP